jgi:AcrR family transcriptional regulator
MTNESTTKSGNAAPKSGPRGADRHQRRVSRTRSKLMESARAVFAEKGFDLATIDDITEGADVGKGTFYYHFRNKARLVRELIREVMHGLAETITAEVGDASSLDEVLDRIIRAHVKFFSDRWEDFTLYFQSRADLTLEEGYEGLESPFVEYLDCIERHVASALKQKVTPKSLRRIACAVAGLVSGYYSFILIETDSGQIESVMRSVRGALVAGLTEFTKEAVS